MKKTLTNRWCVFWVLAAQYLIVYFHRVSPAVIASDLVDSFSISGVDAVIFQPFMGYILDKGGKTGDMYAPSSYKILLWVLFITSIIALISIMQCRETFRKV